ncbi:hypothetical protein QUG64_03810 [Acinetobacter lwoffii]|uniref:TipAS antibiotic-recognition domain-containing protein n=1 Tax=Acinetobacter lwoffii NCTC 5866 = CIP 64.10 = NIPH 512 TaxID=981327 RepID=A0ABP2ZL99_ACILW|nr:MULTISPECIES: hypothetical protein [Acinetobacter]ENU17001.1 hypothetical protein F995_00621 [Acinetobacter sp. CIP A162]ESJ96435.1 hypothetical protein P800_01259 [Acinetobacter lwoffii NCTC 5866 = CIP 64.10 = NIPH 512]QXB40091.1 hypothetical protein I6L23_12980 [Acinetobacter lwoffii]SUU37346.1 Uncharacterised protein [Acinetobacter lwoffii]VFQ39253.1 Uncharacterised protein [Acinetobacter lwoffii]
MDIQDRAFKEWFAQYDNNIEYASEKIAWDAWKEAKAQAVPEVLRKFCNEHKDPAWRGRLTEYDKGYSDCCIAVLEMIEAQEPAND